MPIFIYKSEKIFYETYGSGPLLILHHGFGSDKSSWIKYNWINSLTKDFKILIFDALGHGSSNKPHNSTKYTIEEMAKLSLNLAKNLDYEKFGFLGFSLGGRVGFEIAENYSKYLNFLVIGGMHHKPPSVNKDIYERNIFILKSKKGNFVTKGNLHRPSNDPLALAASYEAMLMWKGISNDKIKFDFPILMFCGEKDKYYNDVRLFAKEKKIKFIAIPKANHFGSLQSSSEAFIHINNFMIDNKLEEKKWKKNA